VYRFITLDTVEEKIIKLQERKELLAETFVDSNNPLKAIDQGMLLEIIG
jgi:SNF2 family DNA or RNA helicase